MSLVSFRAKNHPQQVAINGACEDTDDRRTPDELWVPLNARYQFTLDAAATAENTKCERWCRDGLAEPWSGRVWCNPPYSGIGSWVKKAWHEYRRPDCPLIVMLLPANRTEQAWWQDHVEVWRGVDPRRGTFQVRFLRGRHRFNRPGWTKPTKGDRPPFGLCLLVWGDEAPLPMLQSATNPATNKEAKGL